MGRAKVGKLPDAESCTVAASFLGALVNERQLPKLKDARFIAGLEPRPASSEK